MLRLQSLIGYKSEFMGRENTKQLLLGLTGSGKIGKEKANEGQCNQHWGTPCLLKVMG